MLREAVLPWMPTEAAAPPMLTRRPQSTRLAQQEVHAASSNGVDGASAGERTLEAAASACAAALRTLLQLYRLARACLRHHSSYESGERPWVVNCVNAVRVAAAGGAVALSQVRFCVLNCNRARAYLIVDKGHEVLRELQLDVGGDVATSLKGLRSALLGKDGHRVHEGRPAGIEPAVPLLVVTSPGNEPGKRPRA